MTHSSEIAPLTGPPVPPAVDSINLRKEVLAACQELSRLGHFVGTWGNISVRVTEGLLVTPSKVDYSTMTPEDLVVLDWEGNRLTGQRPATSESELHRQLLLARADMGAIVHTHSPLASAVCVARQSIPAVVEDVAQILGGEIPCVPYTPSGNAGALAATVCKHLGTSAMAALLANHGAVVAGRDLAEALVAAQVLEKAAGLYLHAHQLGTVTALPPEMVREERYRFLFKYGQDTDTPEDCNP